MPPLCAYRHHLSLPQLVGGIWSGVCVRRVWADGLTWERVVTPLATPCVVLGRRQSKLVQEAGVVVEVGGQRDQAVRVQLLDAAATG